jgi:hypothetical protein
LEQGKKRAIGEISNQAANAVKRKSEHPKKMSFESFKMKK